MDKHQPVVAIIGSTEHLQSMLDLAIPKVVATSSEVEIREALSSGAIVVTPSALSHVLGQAIFDAVNNSRDQDGTKRNGGETRRNSK